MDKQEDPGNDSKKPAEDDVRTGSDVDALGSEAAKPLDGREDETAARGSRSGDERFPLAPEELPTMQWSDVYAELADFEDLEISSSPPMGVPSHTRSQASKAGPLDGLEDAMAWLEELAAGQGMPIDEMPTLVSTKPDVVDLPSQEEAGVDVPSGADLDALTLDVDSDPMAWLEQLAVDQNSPLEELPSVADRLLASEIVSQTGIPPNSTINDPYDIDEALNYLERAAEKQGVDLSAVEFDARQPLDNLRAALAIVDGLALTGLAARSASLKKEAMPDGNGGARAADEPEILAEPPGAVQTVEEGELEDAGVVDNALLLQDDGGMGPVTTNGAADLSAEMPDDPHEALDWLGTIDDTDEEATVTVVVEEDTVGPKVDQDQSAEETSAEKQIHVDNAAQFNSDVLQEMPDDPDEAVAWMEDLARQSSQNSASVGEKQSSEKERPSQVAVTPSPDQEAALAALAGGDLDKAFGPIQAILDDEAATFELVEALEDAVEQHQESPRLLRFLGDAYMQVGEVDRAIATYRKGFDHL